MSAGLGRMGMAATLVVLTSVVLLGCGLSAEERIAVQEKQLQSFIERADGWGSEIIAQIPEDEVELLSDPAGGSRGVNGYEQWPRLYYFDRIVVLRADGPRSPTEVADDLEPWLSDQGWTRAKDGEFPPGEESFARDYFRDGYHLALEIYTVEPPRAQSLQIAIVTPTTDAGRSFDE